MQKLFLSFQPFRYVQCGIIGNQVAKLGSVAVTVAVVVAVDVVVAVAVFDTVVDAAQLRWSTAASNTPA